MGIDVARSARRRRRSRLGIAQHQGRPLEQHAADAEVPEHVRDPPGRLAPDEGGEPIANPDFPQPLDEELRGPARELRRVGG